MEVEALAAGTYRVQQSVGLSSGQHEMDVVGGLFQGLKQGVAGCLGEHMGLIEDEDPLRPTGRGHG